MNGNGDVEFPPAPHGRIRTYWNGLGSGTRSSLTVVVTVMVAVVMVVQAAAFVWAVQASKRDQVQRQADLANLLSRAQEQRQKELAQVLGQIHDLAATQDREGSSHRCRTEQLLRELFDNTRLPVPVYPKGSLPPHDCPFIESEGQ